MSTKTKSAVEPHDDDDGAYSVDQFCKRYSIGKTAFYAEVKAKRLSVKKNGLRSTETHDELDAYRNSLFGEPPKRKSSTPFPL